MAWINEAHSQWHAINGPYGCPLDCSDWADEGQWDATVETLSAVAAVLPQPAQPPF